MMVIFLGLNHNGRRCRCVDRGGSRVCGWWRNDRQCGHPLANISVHNPTQPAQQKQQCDDASPPQLGVGDPPTAVSGNAQCERRPILVGRRRIFLPARIEKPLYPFTFIQTQETYIASHDPFAEDSAGQLVERVGFKRLQASHGHLCRLRNIFQTDRAALSLAAKGFSEVFDGCSSCRHR